MNEDRLRFDFSHFSAMTAEELQKVEEIVNEQIVAGLPVKVENMPIEEARKTGAQALFGENTEMWYELSIWETTLLNSVEELT